MREKPKILKTQIVARTRLFQVQQLDLRFSNGVETQYERLLGSAMGAVLVVAMPDPETILLIREYAAGVHRYELGFPKGRVEHGEDVLSAANRELKEEIGCGARDLRILSSLSVAPGYLSHHTHIVLARDLYEQRLPGDEPEEIQVLPWELRQIDTLVTRQDFTEARSIAALFLTREFLSNERK